MIVLCLTCSLLPNDGGAVLSHSLVMVVVCLTLCPSLLMAVLLCFTLCLTPSDGGAVLSHSPLVMVVYLTLYLTP